MSNEIIQNVAYDNYNDFQHVNFIFSQNFISLFCGLFNDKTELKVRYIIFNIFSKVFFKKLWCNNVDDHPQKRLAKLGYRLERKVKKILGILPYFGDLLEPIIVSNMAISEFCDVEVTLMTLVQFFSQIFLGMTCIGFFF
jgi:isopentenyldiphosphate isomerase